MLTVLDALKFGFQMLPCGVALLQEAKQEVLQAYPSALGPLVAVPRKPGQRLGGQLPGGNYFLNF